VAGYVHAHGVNWEERLLDLPNHVWDTMELGIHHRAAVALTVTQVRLGHVLHHLVGLRRARSHRRPGPHRGDYGGGHRAPGTLSGG
jgi:hypothetical protein